MHLLIMLASGTVIGTILHGFGGLFGSLAGIPGPN
jgi:hypothetical protein